MSKETLTAVAFAVLPKFIFSLTGLIIGGMYLGDCPGKPAIPELLIAYGVLGFLSICIMFVSKVSHFYHFLHLEKKSCTLLLAIFIWFTNKHDHDLKGSSLSLLPSY